MAAHRGKKLVPLLQARCRSSHKSLVCASTCYLLSTLKLFCGKTGAAVCLQPVAKRSRRIFVGKRTRTQAVPHALVAKIGFLNARAYAGKQRGMLGLIGFPGGAGVGFGFVRPNLQHEGAGGRERQRPLRSWLVPMSAGGGATIAAFVGVVRAVGGAVATAGAIAGDVAGFGGALAGVGVACATAAGGGTTGFFVSSATIAAGLACA